jgi:divalent metal cation (Fe/Co/Zn/Cd) transporter
VAGAWLGFERADPAVGLIISIAIFAVLRTAARQVFHRLMDAVDPAIVTQIEEAASDVNGVERVGCVQARWVGHRLAATFAGVVDEDLSVRQGHDVAEDARHHLLHEIRHLNDVDVHVDPCGHSGTDPRAVANHDHS